MPATSDPRNYAPLLSHGDVRQASIDERQTAVVLLETLTPTDALHFALERMVAGEVVAERAFTELRRRENEAALLLAREHNK